MLLMVSSASFSAETRDPYKFFFDETFGDLTEEIENAKEQNKKSIEFYEK